MAIDTPAAPPTAELPVLADGPPRTPRRRRRQRSGLQNGLLLIGYAVGTMIVTLGTLLLLLLVAPMALGSVVGGCGGG